jgi:hypothetical protein
MKHRLLLILLLAGLAQAADRRIQVDPTGVREILIEHLDKPRKAEVQMKRGDTLLGMLTMAMGNGFQLQVNVNGAWEYEAIAYEQVSRIRMTVGSKLFRKWLVIEIH